MPRKLFISAGHGGSDSGALGNGFVEATLTLALRRLLVTELQNLGIQPITDPDNNALKQTLAWLRGKFGKKDILLDIHWNASSDNRAHGSEIIVPNKSSRFERNLSAALLKVFTDIGFKNRGVKPESQTERKILGWMRPNAENILIEVYFITNKNDMILYNNSRNIIAKRLAYVLRDYINK
jgi:N-acetylmuramoyl-L-alanine amidase